MAPNNGQYITAQLAAGGVSDTWCHLDNFTIQETTSLQTIQQNAYFQISPNPATTEINIRQLQSVNQKESVSILNHLGQKLFTSSYSEKIDVSNLASGLYYLEIRTDNEIYFTKFLKQ
ncbi:MAG: T9SS type A sorting domain-containing protein [Bacteroidetes bacterium]|nr:T9SS type A sorting domain-containing protein [Bacteroidota bacterium]